jgi:hypothetical protein
MCQGSLLSPEFWDIVLDPLLQKLEARSKPGGRTADGISPWLLTRAAVNDDETECGEDEGAYADDMSVVHTGPALGPLVDAAVAFCAEVESFMRTEEWGLDADKCKHMLILPGLYVRSNAVPDLHDARGAGGTAWHVLRSSLVRPAGSPAEFDDHGNLLSSPHLRRLPFSLVDSLKILGVTWDAIDGRLSFDSHVLEKLHSAERRLTFLYALRSLGAPWTVLRSAAWGMVLSRFNYGIAVWGFCIAPEVWKRIDIELTNKLTRVCTYSTRLVRVETSRLLCGIPGAFTRFHTEVVCAADLLLRGRALLGGNHEVERRIRDGAAAQDTIIFAGPVGQELPSKPKTDAHGESPDHAPLAVPHHILGGTSYTSVARSVLSGAPQLCGLINMPRAPEPAEKPTLLYPNTKGELGADDTVPVQRWLGVCDATALRSSSTGYWRFYGLFALWDRALGARPRIFVRCVGQAVGKVVYEGEARILVEMLEMMAQVLRLRHGETLGCPPALAVPAPAIPVPSTENSPFLAIHDCLGCQEDARVIDALNALGGNGVLRHTHSHIADTIAPLRSLELPVGNVPVRIDPHTFLDAVDTLLGTEAKRLHARIEAEALLPGPEVFLIGLTREGLVGALRNAVWEETINDPWLTGKKKVPPKHADAYPSVSLKHLQESGLTLGAVKSLMKKCQGSRSERLLLQVLSGQAFKAIDERKKYVTVLVGWF